MAIKPKDAQITAQKAYAWFNESTNALSKARKEAQTDCDYYDGDQWSKEDKEELKDRGQPEIVSGRLKATMDLVLGTERRIRVDYKALPRTGAHVEDANVATHLLKHVMDQTEGEFIQSECFEEKTKAGWSWLEIAKNTDPFGDPIKIDREHRNNMFWDPHAKRYDLKDAKYIGRQKWLDLEDAQALFPKWKDELKQAIDAEYSEGYRQPYEITGDEFDPHGSIFDWEDKDAGIHRHDWIDKERKRVRLLEIWYKVPIEILVLHDRLTGTKEEANLADPRIVHKLIDPNIEAKRSTIKKVRISIIAGPNVLQDRWTPYQDNEYPFVRFLAFKKDRTNEPYGLIREMRSPQDEINKRKSKALHILNAVRVVAEHGAVEDVEEARKEVSRPDCWLNTNPEKQLEINTDTQLAEAQFKLMLQAMEEIQYRVPLELMGHESNAQSGKAISLRQASGHTMLATLFDNYRRSRQLVGKLLWSRIQQFYTTPMVIRTIDQAGNYEFVSINEEMTDEETGRVFIRNAISRAQVDIKIDEEAYHATVRQAVLEQMMDLATKLPPEISLALLDVIVSYTDMPGKDEMVARIQQVQARMGMMAPAGSPPPPA